MNILLEEGKGEFEIEIKFRYNKYIRIINVVFVVYLSFIDWDIDFSRVLVIC